VAGGRSHCARHEIPVRILGEDLVVVRRVVRQPVSAQESAGAVTTQATVLEPIVLPTA
jgi:hypothetical protein